MVTGIEITTIQGLGGLILFIVFFILASNSTNQFAVLFSLESLSLGILVVLVAVATNLNDLYLIAIFIIVGKAIIIPWILRLVGKRMNLKEEKEPFVNMAFIFIVAGILTVLAFMLVQPLLNYSTDITQITQDLLPLSFAIILIGFFILTIKKKANAQVMGLLVMDNGIALAGISTTYGMPVIIELIILIDIVMAIIIMAIFLNRIVQNYTSIDISKMNTLRD